MKKKLLGSAAAVVLGLSITFVTVGAYAADDPGYTSELLGKAQPDECFNGVGQLYPAGPPCAEGQAKVNQSYVWGLTRVGTQVWFGTGPNVFCMTSGANLGQTTPLLNDDYVCEYGQSQVAKKGVPAPVGDFRPPQIWMYDSANKTLTNRSSEILNASAGDSRRLRSTLGIRSAGNANGIAFFAGPTLETTLNIFAFDTTTNKFLGSKNILKYGNARTFLNVDGTLFLGVGIGPNGKKGGAVLHWTGSKSNPFQFEEVGKLPTQAADLAYYDGRLAATTWGTGSATNDGQLSGVWTSPTLPLTTASAGNWTQSFNVGQYEPDPLIKNTTNLGGVASYGGYLYWGTMYVPLKSTKVHQAAYPQTTDDAKKAQTKATQRAISIWRGKDLGTANQKIELLYGESQLPAYDPTSATWSAKPTGWTALDGKSGFGNGFNNYTWRMAVSDGKLFVATMDWSYLVHTLSSTANPTDPAGWGADLWMFPNTTDKATPINTTGFGNYLNYGIRNMVVDGSDIYLGMANPMNLRTDRTDTIPEGGWELIRLHKATS
ncbi:MAG: hypothetical protein QOH97_775 [Actinoplanes sp.]|nr:hypothetical protein [Actinoplanes sp.]